MKKPILAIIFLVVIVWVVFGQTLHFDFVNYDDDEYVYENPIIAGGLHWQAIAWVFTHSLCSNWHPLTWVSHMLDCQFYQLHAGGHHMTSVMIHTVTVIALFMWLRKFTGNFWRSIFVTAVFAIHPLRVESVAWVSERKDVLSGLFFVLTIWTYSAYVRQNDGGKSAPVTRRRPKLWYALALLMYALGLMCKPMLVTLPFVLLLIDYWPLRKGKDSLAIFRQPSIYWEKLPFLILAVASCIITVRSQTAAESSLQQLSVPWRIENALVAYVDYLRQMFYPVGLAAFYPLPQVRPPLWNVLLAALVLVAVSVGVIVVRRKLPWLVVGWLWYLGMLMPVIGLVQVGGQAHADRYTYLPQIGLCLMVIWSAAELFGPHRNQRLILICSGVAILTGLVAMARVQTSYWQNGTTLWTHALACTTENWLAHKNLGSELEKQGKFDEAIDHYQATLQINPKDAQAYYDWGIALAAQKKWAEAVAQYERALEIRPDYFEAHNNLGYALINQGNPDEAIKHFERALQINPNHARAHLNLGNVLAAQGRLPEAVEHYQRALQIKPDYTLAYVNLGNALGREGKLSEAADNFQRAAALADAQGNVGLAQAIRAQLDAMHNAPSRQ